MLFSLFCNFLSLHEWESIIPLKVRALRMGCAVYFRLQATFLTGSKSNRIQRLKQKKHLIWSQICSSLLQWEGGHTFFLYEAKPFKAGAAWA